MKYKYFKNFYDPIYEVRYGVVLTTKEEADEISAMENMDKWVGYFDSKQNNFVFKDTDLNTIAHEAFHGMEYILFKRRNVSINLSDFNEHLAYYMGFLVKNIDKCLTQLKKKL